MAELADALDLGSSSNGVGVQVLFPAPINSHKLSCVFFYALFLANKFYSKITTYINEKKSPRKRKLTY